MRKVKKRKIHLIITPLISSCFSSMITNEAGEETDSASITNPDTGAPITDPDTGFIISDPDA